MIAVAYYLLKVTICSIILYLYYLAILKNKHFHHYNRFYLLGIVLFSWLFPLIKINPVAQSISSSPAVYHIVQAIADNNASYENMAIENGKTFDWNFLVSLVAGMVSLTILIIFLRSLWNIYSIKRKCSSIYFKEVKLIMTDAPGTPFSFFNYIFWNNSIDPDSKIGYQILLHELTHVREKHSFDKTFIEILMVFGWFNPIFWIIKKELYMVHEFIADEQSVENHDSSTLAEILLTAAFPQQQYILRNSFFFSPIKRRIIMLSKNTNSRFSYLRRFFALPIIMIVVVLFAFKDAADSVHSVHPKLNKKYVVIIDAGHGGRDQGVLSQTDVKEKDLNLSIEKKIKELNTNPDIEIILTRESDEFIPLPKRSELTKSANADLFVSIHANASDNSQKEGLELYISRKETAFHQQSLVLANMLNNTVGKVLPSSHGVKIREPQKIWVLENAACPSALIEVGFISNPTDLKIMKENQKEIAEKVLEGINNYLAGIDKKQQ